MSIELFKFRSHQLNRLTCLFLGSDLEFNDTGLCYEVKLKFRIIIEGQTIFYTHILQTDALKHLVIRELDQYVENHRSVFENWFKALIINDMYSEHEINLSIDNERVKTHRANSKDPMFDRLELQAHDCKFTLSIYELINISRLCQRAIILEMFLRQEKTGFPKIVDLAWFPENGVKKELQYLIDIDYVQMLTPNNPIINNSFRLTAKGIKRFEELHLGFGRSVFMIAWCDPTVDWLIQYCKHMIEDEFHYQFYLQEREEPRSDITSEIKEKIQNCTFIIADLTGGRENCLYELGYAHALHKRVIITRKASEIEIPTKGRGKVWRLTFDINQFKHSKWDSENDGKFKDELRQRISQTIKAIEQDYFSI